MNPKLLKTTLAVTLSVIYGVLPATAENPYQDGTLGNPTVSTGTGSTGSTINTATNSGQQTAISNTVGATAQDGQGTMAGTSSIPSTSNQTDLEKSAGLDRSGPLAALSGDGWPATDAHSQGNRENPASGYAHRRHEPAPVGQGAHGAHGLALALWKDNKNPAGAGFLLWETG